MKLCTLLKNPNTPDQEVIDVSLVPDDHKFGLYGGYLHVEGRIESVEGNDGTEAG